jgi:sugar lactone lactonase YvrE
MRLALGSRMLSRFGAGSCDLRWSVWPIVHSLLLNTIDTGKRLAANCRRVSLRISTTLFVSIFAGFSILSTAAQSVYPEAYTFTTLAGYPGEGSADGVGSDAQFFFPACIASDKAGNIYVADTDNNTIRRITPSGLVSTIAGIPGVFGHVDGPASLAQFSVPTGVAVDAATNIFVAEANFIRRITPAGTGWIVTTIAGSGQVGSTDGMGPVASFFYPRGLALDNSGNIYVADSGNSSLRKISPVETNWMVTTIAGSVLNRGSADGTNSAAEFGFGSDGLPIGLSVDASSNIYVPDYGNNNIRKVTPIGTNWIVSTIAGLAGNYGMTDGSNSTARFRLPLSVAVDDSNNIYVADCVNSIIRKIRPVGTNWVVSTLAGSTNGFIGYSDGIGISSQFRFPEGVAVDRKGNILVADTGNNLIRKINSADVVVTVAGSAQSAQSVDGSRSVARFNRPRAVAVDASGDVFVTDHDNSTIRKVTAAGAVSTIAGIAGSSGYIDGVFDTARFDFPEGVAVDNSGNIYVADGSSIIRKITPTYIVSTLAGSPYILGSMDGTNSVARFASPQGIAVDTHGAVYVADTGNSTIRKLTPAGTNWVVTTIAGLAGMQGSSDGTNDTARFNNPSGLVVDGSGCIYVADTGNNTIRKILPIGTNWMVTTLAGNPSVTNSYGDQNGACVDGTGTNALFSRPSDISLDNGGNLYVVESATIRKINPAAQVITLAGTHLNVGSVDGTGEAARFYDPRGIAVDSAGNVYVADTSNNTIRKGTFTAYGAANQVAYSPPAMNSSLTVALLPPMANGQWRFPWELSWRDSGTTASNLVAGNYPIQLRNVPDYVTVPPGNPIPVTNNGLTSVSFQYYPTIDSVETNNSVGSLTVNIGPSPPPGVGWRFLGAGGSYFPSGFTTNLPAGIYLIEFEPVDEFSQPPNQQVQVIGGATTTLAESYLLATTHLPNGVLLPTPVPANQITDSVNYPFAFNGQLQSDVEVGYGSGVAVLPNVVLTAAHIVFNDQTLSYVSQVYWRGQEEAGTFEPQPQMARSYCVLTDYAGRRTNDVRGGLGPDQSSPQSRNLDVAALYFPQPVAGGGYGGYLPSDATPNTWLTSTSLKMLVGYPVDGSQFGKADIVPGLMYQTQPQPYPLSLATDPVDNQQVYAAPWFLSYPGNSGGPLYVQLNGYYYPAGVYLGTLYNGTQPYASAIRAINSDVVNLITNAAALGDSGTNSTGGGVILLTPGASSLFRLGYFSIQFAPSNTVDAGAAWRILELTNTAYYSNSAIFGLPTGHYTLSFRPLATYLTPTNRPLQLTDNVTNVIAAIYMTLQPTASALNATAGTASLLFTNAPLGQSYAIERSTNLENWLPLATNHVAADGTLRFTNSGLNNVPNAFYRARLVP